MKSPLTKSNAMQKTKSKTQKVDIYQKVTDKIIKLLESNTIPWRKPWSDYGLARNYLTNKPYKGINYLMLNYVAEHEIPVYLTFNQIKKLGGNLKKGSVSEQVIFYNMVYKDQNNNTVSKEDVQDKGFSSVRKFVKYFNVFNVADIEGIDFDFPKVELKDNQNILSCESVFENMPNKPKFEQTDKRRAFYNGLSDSINMPSIKQFKTSNHYYSTLFHELVHSTGHETRLNREGVTQANKEKKAKYAFEELIAEMGASYLCSSTGIQRDDLMENTAAYLQSWLRALKDDKQFIFKAAAESQKAVDYILSEGV